jgi:hypothetical protein
MKYDLPSGIAGIETSSDNLDFCEIEYHYPCKRSELEKALQESLEHIIRRDQRWAQLKELLQISIDNYSDSFNMQVYREVIKEMERLEK